MKNLEYAMICTYKSCIKHIMSLFYYTAKYLSETFLADKSRRSGVIDCHWLRTNVSMVPSQ